MNIAGDYGVSSNYNGYNAAKTSQTSGKPFTIPTQEAPTQTFKLTQKISTDAEILSSLTFIGYGDFDPFKEIAETGSFKIPEFMQTKTEPTRSDEEILRELEKLAKEHAKTGVWDPCSDERYLKLMDEYISSVSPDRENFLKKEIDEILERIKTELSAMSGTEGLEEEDEEEKDEKQLIDYLLEVLAKRDKNVIATRSDGHYTVVDYDRGDGRVTTLVYDNKGNQQPGMHMTSDSYSVQVLNGDKVDHAFFYGENGDMIASYHNNKLYQAYTKEENTRLFELRGVYEATFNVATGRQGQVNPSKTYNEAYNSTYNRLRSGAAA
jgi:hypothetical protein